MLIMWYFKKKETKEKSDMAQEVIKIRGGQALKGEVEIR
mgnify:FL=1